jgi:hypothetical protein
MGSASAALGPAHAAPAVADASGRPAIVVAGAQQAAMLVSVKGTRTPARPGVTGSQGGSLDKPELELAAAVLGGVHFPEYPRPFKARALVAHRTVGVVRLRLGGIGGRAPPFVV